MADVFPRPMPWHTRAADYVVRGEAWPFVNLVYELGVPAAPLFEVTSALTESPGRYSVDAALAWRHGTRHRGAAVALPASVAVSGNDAR
jgi:hypothetical protein